MTQRGQAKVNTDHSHEDNPNEAEPSRASQAGAFGVTDAPSAPPIRTGNELGLLPTKTTFVFCEVEISLVASMPFHWSSAVVTSAETIF